MHFYSQGPPKMLRKLLLRDLAIEEEFCRAEKVQQGRWNASLLTREPSEPNSAQEKSSRSLILTLILVRCKTLPICSAMPMNLYTCLSTNKIALKGCKMMSQPLSLETLLDCRPCIIDMQLCIKLSHLG